MNNYSLNIAIIVEDFHLPAWQVAMLRRVNALPYAEIKLIFLADKAKSWSLNKAKLNFFKRIRYLESKLLEETHPADQMVNIGSLFDGGFIKLSSSLAKDEYFNHAINLVVNLASGNDLPEFLVSNSSYGVWHYFYNSHLERISNWASLQEFSLNQNGIVSGVLVNSSYFNQSRYLWVSYTSKQCLLSKTHDNLLWKMVEFIPVLCQQASRFESGKKFIQDRYLKTLIDKVIYIDSTCYCSLVTENFLVLSVGFVSAHLNRLIKKLSLHKQWVLLKTENDLLTADFSKTCESKILYQPQQGFVADPCLVEENGEKYVFFEEFVESTGRGRIVCAKLDDLEKNQQITVVLEKDYHLSYPFVFKSEGTWYLVPESAENHTVDLYRCIQFPDRWEFVKSLLTDIDAYDATLYEYASRWWIFVNIRPHLSTSPNELLYLFSAESLLADHWQAHPANPIIHHADKARPAGALFECDGLIYRPSQNCAGSYGQGLNLNAIIEWNEQTYKEKTVAVCLPKGKCSLDGIHSISCIDSTVISDGIYTRKRWRKA
ncbi:MAG: hypothetical protein ACH34X_17015 [Thiolinea sp.]